MPWGNDLSQQTGNGKNLPHENILDSLAFILMSKDIYVYVPSKSPSQKNFFLIALILDYTFYRKSLRWKMQEINKQKTMYLHFFNG